MNPLQQEIDRICILFIKRMCEIIPSAVKTFFHAISIANVAYFNHDIFVCNLDKYGTSTFN